MVYSSHGTTVAMPFFCQQTKNSSVQPLRPLALPLALVYLLLLLGFSLHCHPDTSVHAPEISLSGAVAASDWHPGCLACELLLETPGSQPEEVPNIGPHLLMVTPSAPDSFSSGSASSCPGLSASRAPPVV